MISVDIDNKFAVEHNNNLVSFQLFLGVLGGENGQDPDDLKKCQGAQNAKILKMGNIKKKGYEN